jgi:hypothetical protein
VTRDEPGEDRATLIREILDYVLRHPDAKDTPNGIHRFWLSSYTAHQSPERVREALDYLADEKGWLIKKVSGSSVALYGLDKRYSLAVREFLGRCVAD